MVSIAIGQSNWPVELDLVASPVELDLEEFAMYRIIAVSRTARKTISPGPLPRIGSSQLAGLVLYPEPTEEVRHVPVGCRSSVATSIGPVELADVAIPSRTRRQSN